MSPLDTVYIDKVTDVSTSLTLAGKNGDYEFSIPLSALGLAAAPTDGMKTIGDIGILRGNTGQTVQRIYWNNKNTTLTADIPTEGKFYPNNWGQWVFKAGNVGVSLGHIHNNAGRQWQLKTIGSLIQASNLSAEPLMLIVSDAAGKTVYRCSMAPGSSMTGLDKKLGAGAYVYRLVNPNGLSVAQTRSLVMR